MAELHRDGKPMFHAESLGQWRDWLHRNHDVSSGVWLVVWKKHSGKPALAYSDTVDEALAYGWIDSRTNRLDDERATRWFCPRNPTSPWSRINRAKIARLVEEGRLQPAGQALVDAARANGAWTISNEIEDLVIPEDLAEALQSNPSAEAHFARFPASAKKIILWWIKSAKTAPTRARRIATTVERAAENRMANHPRGRDQGPRVRPT
ncbi:MAG: YdeI/OmpD-associated family protein [Chloroflexota bacterium]|nr:YdeI/OmpD-associated family protein [Chloroflexota bacterium]MDE2920365.1 YdeI/OmpD-associated family protein [Chloroflexota bacterium]